MGQRRGHERRVGGRQPVGLHHGTGLVGQAAVGMEHSLGVAGGTGGEQDDGEIDTPSPAGPELRAVQQRVEARGVPPHADGRCQVGQWHARRRQRNRGPEEVEHARHLARSHLMMNGRGNRPAAPGRPEQGHRLPPIGQLPADDVAAAYPRRLEPAGQRARQPLERTGIQCYVAVHHRSTRRRGGRGEQPVQGRHIPGSTRSQVPRGLSLAVGGAEGHEAGTGPSTASGAASRTGGASRQLGTPSSGSATGYLLSWIPAQCA